MKKPIPKFQNEAEEFEFWSSTGPGADSTKYTDWSQAKRATFPNLKPTPTNASRPPEHKSVARVTRFSRGSGG